MYTEIIKPILEILGGISSLIAIILFVTKIIRWQKGNLSWQKVETTIEELAKKLQESTFSPDILIGVGKGGSISSGILAVKYKSIPIYHANREFIFDEQTGKRTDTKISFNDPGISNKKVLIVVGENKSGVVLKETKDLINKLKPEQLKTAALFSISNPNAIEPDFVGIESKKQLILPWDD